MTGLSVTLYLAATIFVALALFSLVKSSNQAATRKKIGDEAAPKILRYFSYDRENGLTIYGGGKSEDGTYFDFVVEVERNRSYGGIPYEEFARSDRGTILWNPSTRSGEILYPGDKRWADYKNN